MNETRSGTERRQSEHCDMHANNTTTLEHHSDTLNQIKGGLLIASIAVSLIGTICGGVITYYVYTNSKTMETLSTDLKEIHLTVHESQLLSANSSITLNALESDIKELREARR